MIGKKRILLFAGTTEGRKLAEGLKELPVTVFVSTATEYGKECVGNSANIKAMAGRMDEEAIKSFMKEQKINLVIDATHPFATAVTHNIKKACARCKTEYIRCLREKEELNEKDLEDMVFVNSVKEAAEYLKGTEGNIFISTGSKELKCYTEIKDYKERCYARVLSTRVAVEESADIGFEGSHLIAMQGPFTKELNKAMLAYADAKYFVTKESGKAGGFDEKVKAAREAGAILIVIGRPEESGGKSMESILEYVREMQQ